MDGYAAPQLHTHAVIFNMTERDNGTMRALQQRGLFESQQFATAVYQSHLTYQLRSSRLRNRAWQERRTGDQRLLAGVP